MIYTLTVAGTPAPKGSMKCVGQHGRHQIIEDDKNGTRKLWRSQITAAGTLLSKRIGRTLHGPVGMLLLFSVPRPPSVGKTRQAVTRSSGDIDKLARMALDALDDAGVYADDSRVVELLARKRYAATPDDFTGLHVLVWDLAESPDGMATAMRAVSW